MTIGTQPTPTRTTHTRTLLQRFRRDQPVVDDAAAAAAAYCFHQPRIPPTGRKEWGEPVTTSKALPLGSKTIGKRQHVPLLMPVEKRRYFFFIKKFTLLTHANGVLQLKNTFNYIVSFLFYLVLALKSPLFLCVYTHNSYRFIFF